MKQPRRKFFPENEAKTAAPANFSALALDKLSHVATFVLPIRQNTGETGPQARVAQLVERDLAKVEVASSNLVSRSNKEKRCLWAAFFVFALFAMAAPRKCLSTDEEFAQAVAESLSVAQVLGRIGLVPAGGNYKTVQARIRRLGLDTEHFTGKGWNQGSRYRRFGKVVSLTELLVENSTYAFTHGLRQRLLKEGLKTHRCEQCGLTEWLGRPIALELHHVNGRRDDHRLINLQLLCPNCHAQTSSYRGKNQRKSLSQSGVTGSHARLKILFP